MGPAHPCHTRRRPFMHSTGPYGPAGLLSPWTVRPLDVRNTLGSSSSSERSALTRMFFDACTSHQVRCAAREARRSLPRPRSSASSPVVLHGGNERFVMLLCELLVGRARHASAEMLSPAMSHRSTDGACCCAGGLDSVQQDSGHLELLAEQYSFARLAAAHLLSLQPQPRITAAVVDASNAATGCRRVTAGGGFWHGPRAPPPPLPLLAPTEAPTKSLFYCRERDRRRFTAAEYRFRLRALENARNAYKVARAHRSSAHAHGHVPMLKHACMALLCSRVPVPYWSTDRILRFGVWSLLRN